MKDLPNAIVRSRVARVLDFFTTQILCITVDKKDDVLGTDIVELLLDDIIRAHRRDEGSTVRLKVIFGKCYAALGGKTNNEALNILKTLCEKHDGKMSQDVSNYVANAITELERG